MRFGTSRAGSNAPCGMLEVAGQYSLWPAQRALKGPLPTVVTKPGPRCCSGLQELKVPSFGSGRRAKSSQWVVGGSHWALLGTAVLLATVCCSPFLKRLALAGRSGASYACLWLSDWRWRKQTVIMKNTFPFPGRIQLPYGSPHRRAHIFSRWRTVLAHARTNQTF